tara:strand:+ start:886 stop:1290 length:405 start_codon:yes stop_codon:yes gene_type:complete
MNNKRTVGTVLGALLVFVPYLAMEYLGANVYGANISISFIDVLFSTEKAIGLASDINHYMFAFLGLVIGTIILNLGTSLKILSSIVGIAALGVHGFLYAGSITLYNKADFGIAWIIIAIGCIVLVVSSLFKKSS